MAFIGAAIGAIGSIGGALLGGDDGTDDAQAAQAAAASQNTAILTKAGNQAVGYLDPYARAGNAGLDALMYGLGLSSKTNPWDIPSYKILNGADPAWNYILKQYRDSGGKIKGPLSSKKNAGLLDDLRKQYLNLKQGGQPTEDQLGFRRGSLLNYNEDDYKKDYGYTPMVRTLEDLQATPGYKFQLEQGLQSVNNSAAAKGSLLSGANLKALNNYAQGQASTGYQAAWERAQNAYNAAFGRNQQKLQNLQSLANNGQQAAGQQGAYRVGAASAIAGVNTNFANNTGSLALASANNNANFYQNIGNALGGLGGAAYGYLNRPNDTGGSPLQDGGWTHYVP